MQFTFRAIETAKGHNEMSLARITRYANYEESSAQSLGKSLTTYNSVDRA